MDCLHQFLRNSDFNFLFEISPSHFPTPETLQQSFRFDLDYDSTDLDELQAAFEAFLLANGYTNITVIAIVRGSVIIIIEGPHHESHALSTQVNNDGGASLGIYDFVGLATVEPSQSPTPELIVVI